MSKETESSNPKGRRRNLEILAGLVVFVAAEMPLLRLIGAAFVIDGIIRQ